MALCYIGRGWLMECEIFISGVGVVETIWEVVPMGQSWYEWGNQDGEWKETIFSPSFFLVAISCWKSNKK